MKGAKPLVSVGEVETLLEELEDQTRVCEAQRGQLTARLQMAPDEELGIYLAKTVATITELKGMTRELENERTSLARARSALKTSPGTMLGKFKVPDWISGRSAAFLVVSKADKNVATIDLAKRDCFLVGRQPELCHITLDHASVSRQHVALVHGAPPDSRHGWFLIDLASAHGTLIQVPGASEMKRCRPETPYALPFGTTFKIGKSSRLYTIQKDSSNNKKRDRPSEEDDQEESLVVPVVDEASSDTAPETQPPKKPKRTPPPADGPPEASSEDQIAST